MVRRGVFDVLRRGLDNAVVNWGLIVVRFVEMLLFAALAVGAALAILVPMLVSIGITVTDLGTAEDFEELLLTLAAKWVWLIWIFVAVSVLLLLLVALHSFVEAGCARVAVDADRLAGAATEGPRTRYRAFSMARFFAGGKGGWWTVFWIYNLAWGVAGLILLLPLIPTVVVMLVARESPPVLLVSGCLGLTATLLLFLVVSTVTSMWTTRATADWALTGAGATATLSGAWAEIKADLGRHLLVVLAVIVIALAGSSFFASFSYFAAFGEIFHRGAIVQFFTIPLRIFGTLCNWAFSGFVSSWYLGAYAALAVESRTVAQSHSLTGTRPTTPL